MPVHIAAVLLALQLTAKDLGEAKEDDIVCGHLSSTKQIHIMKS